MFEVRRTGLHEGVYMYSCSLPTVGDFYVVVYEDYNADTGGAYTSYTFTRDRVDAEKLFNEGREEIAEEWREEIERGLVKVGIM